MDLPPLFLSKVDRDRPPQVGLQNGLEAPVPVELPEAPHEAHGHPLGPLVPARMVDQVDYIVRREPRQVGRDPVAVGGRGLGLAMAASDNEEYVLAAGSLLVRINYILFNVLFHFFYFLMKPLFW